MKQLGDLAAFKDFGVRALRRVAEAGLRISYPPFSTVHVQGYPLTRLIVPFKGEAAAVSFDAAYDIRSAGRVHSGSVAVSPSEGAED